MFKSKSRIKSHKHRKQKHEQSKLKTVSVWLAQYTVVALAEILLLYVPRLISCFSSLPSLQTGVESNNNFFFL